jgi:hypothetical protein
MVRHDVRKKIVNIKSEQKQQTEQNEQNRWRKNKLVLSPEEIKKYL